MLRKTDSIVFRASDLAPQLGTRCSDRLTPGLVAKRDLGRYYALVRASLPTFSREEALAILEIANGIIFESIEDAQALYASVADAVGLGECWGVDQSALATRLRGLTPVEAVAVADACERYWNRAEDGPEQALATSGLVA